MKKIVLVITTIFLILCCSTMLVYYLLFVPNNKVVSAFEEGKTSLVIEGESIEAIAQPEVKDEEVLLPLDIVKKYIDPYIYWDEKLRKVTITTKDRVIRMKTDSLNALINNKPITLKIPVKKENEDILVPIEFLSDFYNIEVSFIKESNVIVINNKNSIKRIAEPLSNDAVVRTGPTIRYPIIKKFNLNSGDPQENIVRIFEEYEKWYKVRTADGAIGYIEKKHAVVKKSPVEKNPIAEPKTVAWKPAKGKINLVWEMMYNGRPELSSINKMEGLDVISPTWFQVLDESGILINRSDAKYVEWAHKNGYKVWALFSNSFGEQSMTHKLLNNTDARDFMIKQLLAAASLYKFDGVNIDFEDVDENDRDILTQFIREITPLLREQGLIVSVDVNRLPAYDFKAIGETVDYVAIMAYDQHWSTSPEAGSVAQIGWVENYVKSTINKIPKEKVLLGVPFYTRLWKEETEGNGKIKLSSQALSMEAAKKAINDNKAAVSWDEESGQFYSEYKKEGATYKIWLEDKNSINLKSALVQKYRLAGTAAWSRKFETPDIWNVLNKNLKEIGDYKEWLALNKAQISY